MLPEDTDAGAPVGGLSDLRGLMATRGRWMGCVAGVGRKGVTEVRENIVRLENLQRITTEFIASEDRICLTGEVSEERARASVVLWLTQRLLNRLAPCFCAWLAGGDNDSPTAELEQEFAQQKAQAELEPQAPVRIVTQTQGDLVYSVDVQTAPGVMVLTFKGHNKQPLATLQLTPLQLRQWLHILHNQFRRAEWPTTAWPSWMEAEVLDSGQCQVMVH